MLSHNLYPVYRLYARDTVHALKVIDSRNNTPSSVDYYNVHTRGSIISLVICLSIIYLVNMPRACIVE